MSILCFLEDIDLISQNSRNLLDGSPGFFGTHLFPTISPNMRSFEIRKNHFPLMIWDLSWVFKSSLGSPKMNNIGFGAQGHVRKSRNHRNEGFEGSHISKSKSYKPKLKQNNTTELLSISSP